MFFFFLIIRDLLSYYKFLPCLYGVYILRQYICKYNLHPCLVISFTKIWNCWLCQEILQQNIHVVSCFLDHLSSCIPCHNGQKFFFIYCNKINNTIASDKLKTITRQFIVILLKNKSSWSTQSWTKTTSNLIYMWQWFRVVSFQKVPTFSLALLFECCFC